VYVLKRLETESNQRHSSYTNLIIIIIIIIGVVVLLVQLMVDLLPMWMWMAPNWMWKPPSAIWATCFQLVVVAITLLLLAVVRPGASSESCCQSSLQSTSLSRHAARCSQLVFGQLCSMAVRPGPQTPPIYNGFAEMTVP